MQCLGRGREGGGEGGQKREAQEKGEKKEVIMTKGKKKGHHTLRVWPCALSATQTSV